MIVCLAAVAYAAPFENSVDGGAAEEVNITILKLAPRWLVRSL